MKWPQMPRFDDESYDRSDWLLDTNPDQLAREHRELLRWAAEVRNAAIRERFEQAGFLFS